MVTWAGTGNQQERGKESLAPGGWHSGNFATVANNGIEFNRTIAELDFRQPAASFPQKPGPGGAMVLLALARGLLLPPECAHPEC